MKDFTLKPWIKMNPSELRLGIMRINFLTWFVLCLSTASTAQTALKFSATDPVSGRYGMSVEHRLNDAFSAGAEVDLLSREVFLEGLSWFISQHAMKRGVVAEPFVRWYPFGSEDLDGVYASLGGFFGLAKYTLDEPDGLGRHTWSARGASLHLGEQKCLGRLVLDVYLGATWANDTYPGVYVESTALHPPPQGLRASGGLRLGWVSNTKGSGAMR
ncbi:hypothetical protein OAW57_01930 [Flavobacteriales bacterium]|jgi:hypothetical protein|nr:hypothetical protein [Flavobacteriales bacterium]